MSLSADRRGGVRFTGRGTMSIAAPLDSPVGTIAASSHYHWTVPLCVWPHSKRRNGRSFPYVIACACTPRSAWLHQNVGFSLYIPDCEARRQTGRKVRQTHRHPGSADDRSGRQTLLGSAVPMRLRKTSHPAYQLSDLRRCSVVRMLAWPSQIRAEAVPGLRHVRHDPARPSKLLPHVRI